ncbi:MAG: hypothetical protein II808_01980 [Clostridia bacterium]|nr:hypothetical protein [Clostridia bacterium]
MKKPFIIAAAAVALALVLAFTATASVGKSWYQDGSGELTAKLTSEGYIKLFGSGAWYPYEFLGFKDKIDIDGFSVKLDVTLWPTAMPDCFAYIAIGDDYRVGCDAVPGVGTFMNIQNGVILKFGRYNGKWSSAIPDSSVTMVYYFVKDGVTIDYGNEFSDVVIDGLYSGDLTVEFVKRDGVWKIRVNGRDTDFLSTHKAGKPGDGKPNLSFLDKVFADGKAYFSFGAVPYADEEVEMNIKEINGVKAIDFLAEGVEPNSSVPAPSSTEPVSSTTETNNNCGNKA